MGEKQAETNAVMIRDLVGQNSSMMASMAQRKSQLEQDNEALKIARIR